ncbi:hypothetical protein NW752_012476 [Fusarium irregulare]|nr:hypothetical protein NW752_012476 [Fusarium irregulare]
MFMADKIGRPLHVERAEYVDLDGYQNHILMPYWTDADHMNKFLGRHDFEVWRRAPRTGSVGWWMESLWGDTDFTDMSFANKSLCGVARHTEHQEMQYHGYMRSMRDRVPGYLARDADGIPSKLVRRQHVKSKGRHLIIQDLPHNLCYIRAAFGYKHAPQEQQEAFHELMMLVLADATRYLTDNPVDSGCFSMRRVKEVHAGFDNETQDEVLGWFLTLQDLERWTEHHPSHLKILRESAAFHKRLNYQAVINQGHEVFVTPQGQVHCEYVNCHPNTGFLPYFPARDII